MRLLSFRRPGRPAGLVATLLLAGLAPLATHATPVRADSSPTPFLWGAATSSYQVEGGISCAQPPPGQPFASFSQAQQPGVPCNDFDFFNGNAGIQSTVQNNSGLAGPQIDLAPAGVADNFWDPRVYRHDFDNARMLGMNSFRISLEWSRIEPSQGVFDQGAIAHYVQMLKDMRARGLAPVVTLSHFTLPIWALMPPQSFCPPPPPLTILQVCFPQPDAGFQSSLQGWTNSALVDTFVDYVNHVVPAMKDLVGTWLTINEPVLSQLEVGYVAGVWSPGFVGDGDRIRNALPNLISAHVRAYDAIKAIYGATPVKVGFAHAMAAVVPAQPTFGTIGDNHAAAANFDYFANDFFVNAVVNGNFDAGYLSNPATRQVTFHPDWANHLDFLGINYYRRLHVFHDDAAALSSANFIGGNTKNNMYGESEPHGLLNDLGWEICPQGLHDLIMRAKNQWNMPVLVTENGIPERSDRNRAPFMVAHVDEVRQAMSEGAKVLGYLYWSLMDNWELSSNYQPASQFGLFHIDRSQKNSDGSLVLHRELTEGALAYQELIAESQATDLAGAPTPAGVASAAARFGTILPDGSAVIPPTQTHGRYWQGNGVNLYLGFRDADSALTGLIAFGSGNLDWHRVDLLHDSTQGLILRESWFDDASGAPVSRDHHVTYAGGKWSGTFTTGAAVQTWSAAPIPGAGLWQWVSGSPWGGSQFSIEDHEGHYAGKFLTFVRNVPSGHPMGPEWRELAETQFDQRLRLRAGDPDVPSFDLFDISLDLSGNQATTAALHSGTWTGFKSLNASLPLELILNLLQLGDPLNPLGFAGYPSPGFFWLGQRTDSPGSPFLFDEGSAVFLSVPAPPPGTDPTQYRKEHDPTSVMPLDNFQFNPGDLLLLQLPGISFEAGGRSYSATTGFDVCVAFPCTGTWADIGGRVASRLSERFPPFVDVGPDRTVEANTAGGANVSLDGTASFDLDGAPLTFTWTGDFGTVAGPTATVFLGLSPSGAPATHRVCLTVSNGTTGATRCASVTVVDTLPPVISCGAADGAWHASDVSIPCTASDVGSGLAQASDASFTLSTSVPAGIETASAVTGTRTVCDRAGNCATAGPIAGNKVDKKPPAIVVQQPAATTYPHSGTLTLDYSVTDQGSGVAAVTPSLDGATSLAGHGLQSGQSINLLTELRLGQHVFTVAATDNVGNAVSATVTFTVVVTPASIQADVNQFTAAGDIMNSGLATSLLATLNAAADARAASQCGVAARQYQAFIDKLQAQSGIGVDPAAAAIMIADAQYLISHCP